MGRARVTGKFSGLELSDDAHWLFFAATTSSDAWRLFKFDLAARQLVQLTDGPWDDFDPCVLPSGRIVFTSTRRGGIGRCGLTPQSLAYTLHSMEADGSDIVPLSFHEGNEWQPSVNHQGKIVYTRWDYVDRHWGTAHHFWECFPDGRDPRTYHGNYPLPRSAMPAGAARAIRAAAAGQRPLPPPRRRNVDSRRPRLAEVHGDGGRTP